MIDLMVTENLTPREITISKILRVVTIGAFAASALLTVLILATAIVADDLNPTIVDAFVGSIVLTVAASVGFAGIQARGTTRSSAQRLRALQERFTERVARHENLRVQLDNARRTGDPMTMLLTAERVMAELEAMRTEWDEHK